MEEGKLLVKEISKYLKQKHDLSYEKES